MKIVCIGRNYVAHAKELNNEVPDTPVIFMKPDTALLRDNKPFYYPDFSQDIHYECELIFRINREGKYIKEKFARGYVDGVGLGIDLTARDIQANAKKKGLPWTLAKGFNHAAPVSHLLDPEQFPDFSDIRFECSLNGELRQSGHSALMIWSPEALISYISQFITLKKGDLVFTGTPAGVGPIQVGDQLQGRIGEEVLLDFEIK